MRLSEYLSEKKISQTAFAEKIGRSIASVSRLAAGLQKPDFDTLMAISRETGGDVGADDFAMAIEERQRSDEAAA